MVTQDPNKGPNSYPIQWPAFVGGSAEVNLQMELPLSIVEDLHDEICTNAWDPFAAALEASQPQQQGRWTTKLQALLGAQATAITKNT